MKFIDKMERKYGRHAIPNLMYYVIVMQIVGIIVGQINPTFLVNYLGLDVAKVMQGQVWRLVTFILTGYAGTINLTNIIDVFLVAIELYLYYYIGRSLENAWGSFRFNLYYISGILFNIITAFILYFVITGLGYDAPRSYGYGLTYVNRSLFLAFAAVFPNMELLYMFLIPLKVKYLGYFYGAFIAYDVVEAFISGQIGIGVSIIVALMNFIIFFISTRNKKRVPMGRKIQRKKYHHAVKEDTTGPRHRCAVCGRTELDDDRLEFRYCSRCEGNYEYCSDHLFTHEHVKKH
ncbi:hypothetical protein lbkm_0724 [Lachnospiraceae bacterium KM106-2]|nr:hypothetical protein lbkm_0724 [Lachnospiraceae bacterium KM106-2]